MTARTGSSRVVAGRHYTRVRIGKKRRVSVALPTCRTEEEANARSAIVAEVANMLIAGGCAHEVREFARKIGAAANDKEIAVYRRAAERAVATGPGVQAGETFGTFSERWTNGSLNRAYPDYVKLKKSAHKDQEILAKHILPTVGDVPLVAFKLEHAEAVMRTIPEGRSAANRRHVAQVMQKVLRYAVYPAKIIPASPLPSGFLPKLGPKKALQYLYPDEDAKLLACKRVPLASRFLYGFLAREGMRYEEALSLAWVEFDLERGAVRLDVNKTDDPRAWALDPGTVRALAIWKKTHPRKIFDDARTHHPAELFRAHLKLAGVDRPSLTEVGPARRQIRLHDQRGTFVTIALANGKTESWVQDRTGHKSSTTVAIYRRAARTIAELGLGELAPLDQAIPELRSKKKRKPK